MVERRRGAVINVVSMSAFQPVPFLAIYAASKAFVLSFTESLATELEGTGVSVQALCPGLIPTEFQAVAGTDRVPFNRTPADVRRGGRAGPPLDALDDAPAGGDPGPRGTGRACACSGSCPAGWCAGSRANCSALRQIRVEKGCWRWYHVRLDSRRVW